jgi:alkyldihydroxyacetonephosphate synthase
MELLLASLLALVFGAGAWLLGRAKPDARAGERSYDPAPGVRHAHLWGYQDTRLEFCGPRTIRMTGSRYPLAGPPLPRFVPFVEDVLGVSLDPQRMRPAAPRPALPRPIIDPDFAAALARCLPGGRVRTDDEERLEHSHGQLSVDEIYRIHNGGAPSRLVDVVVYPATEAEIGALVELASDHGCVLIPYGGGTNVSGALLCPPEEQRTIVSVDMSRLCRILELDRVNLYAVVEAGITGKQLELELEQAGFTCGHVPDSVEFSTLGGWIATHASGMKKNRYGNIEDIVLEARLISPRGVLQTVAVNPRSSTGVQPLGLLFGSEGSLGIVTRAVIQIRPLPQERRYASFVFPSFASGVQFLKDVQASDARPASIRLANNTEFGLGRALGPEPSRWKAARSALQARYVTKVRGFDPGSMVVCTSVMEGTAGEVQHQARGLARLCARAGGLVAGAEAGRRGYQVTFAIAYIRDFLNAFGILGETFETSAPWDRIEPIARAVEDELRALCSAGGIVGRPYLSYRISQSYPTGVCMYFTMGFSGEGLAEPEEVYHRIEHRLRQVILDQGGSLSHHHGVGKVRRAFVSQVHSPGSILALRAIKQALDPDNVFGARNNVFGLEGAQAPGVNDPAHSAPAGEVC